jgi:hypothetical protein
MKKNNVLTTIVMIAAGAAAMLAIGKFIKNVRRLAIAILN